MHSIIQKLYDICVKLNERAGRAIASVSFNSDTEALYLHGEPVLYCSENTTGDPSYERCVMAGLVELYDMIQLLETDDGRREHAALCHQELSQELTYLDQEAERPDTLPYDYLPDRDYRLILVEDFLQQCEAGELTNADGYALATKLGESFALTPTIQPEIARSQLPKDATHVGWFSADDA